MSAEPDEELVDRVGSLLYAGDWTARSLAMASPDLVLNVGYQHVGLQPLRNLAALLGYADQFPATGRKRRIPIVDIDKLVDLWADVLVALATAHDHGARSEADERSDELLGPLLTAPIKEVRTFAQRLSLRLEGDERVPFLVWSTFKRLIAPLVLRGPEGETIALKTQLAMEIAELVEKDLNRADLIASMAAALQWRAPDTLEKVKSGLKRGAKPRLKGGESCLFLHVGEGAEEVSVVL